MKPTKLALLRFVLRSGTATVVVGALVPALASSDEPPPTGPGYTQCLPPLELPLPPEKRELQAILQREERLCREAVRACYDPEGHYLCDYKFEPPVDTGPTPRPGPAANQLTPAGAGAIVQIRQSTVPLSRFRQENYWYEDRDGQLIKVLAGREGWAGDQSQGLLIVYLLTPDWEMVPGSDSLYPTPVKAGSVRIVAAEGERLKLEARDGTPFIFDVATRQYVEQ